jgi:hypothetical protein
METLTIVVDSGEVGSTAVYSRNNNIWFILYFCSAYHSCLGSKCNLSHVMLHTDLSNPGTISQ